MRHQPSAPITFSALHCLLLKPFARRSVRSSGPIFITPLLFALLFTSSQLFAQSTDFNINAASPNLENEFQAELDKWMLRAYEGDRDAQFKVGVLFTNTQFGKEDFEQAVYWYKQAARQGHVLAQYNLGHQYLNGVGVSKNINTAMDWWLQAAEQNHALAQFNVGRAYYLGIGLPKNQSKSRYWFERAAKNQEPKSIDILQQLGWSTVLDEPSVVDKPQTIQPTAKEATSATPTKRLLLSNNSVEKTPVKVNVKPVKKVVASTKTKAKVEKAKVVKDKPEPVAALNTSPTTDSRSAPLAVYTSPKTRAVLITIIDDLDNIEIQSRSGNWSTITSTQGFPVWIHSNFILVADDIGTVSAEEVNARSVPIVAGGTIVGRLRKNESVEVIDSRNDWFRVISPQRFIGWVKTRDLKNSEAILATPKKDKTISPLVPAKRDNDLPELKISTPVNNTSNGTKRFNDNEWLFKQSPEAYTLQLASLDEPEKIAEFISRSKFIDNPELHQFTSEGRNNTNWTYFLYGSYENKKSAERAKRSIKQKLAWIRTFGRLQQNRCVSWKTQLPPPRELNKYCTN